MLKIKYFFKSEANIPGLCDKELKYDIRFTVIHRYHSCHRDNMIGGKIAVFNLSKSEEIEKIH
jgi:hypothetical protein